MRMGKTKKTELGSPGFHRDQAKSRVLFLDYNLNYINPTRNYLNDLLSRACEVYPFGPGHNTEAELSKGVEDFIDQLGGVDLVVATEHVLFWTPKISVSQYRKNYAFSFTQVAVKCTSLMQQFYANWKGAKISLLAESDFWNFTSEQIERLEVYGGVFAGWGQEVVPDLEELREREAGEIPNNNTNHWFKFVERNPTDHFTFLHYIAQEEIVGTPLRQRPQGWSVLGASYLSRRLARERLSAARIPWAGRNQMLVMKVLSRLMRTGLISRSWSIDKINSGFRKGLLDCRYGYTCGAFIRGPIRKFFEIPAAGQVLVCEPFKGASDAGFLDRHTMIESAPEDILDVNEWLIRNPAEAQIIADTGLDMIRKNHSISARADQLREVFNAIIEGHFKGGRWIGGEFKLL
jgi:hypothetical protein